MLKQFIFIKRVENVQQKRSKSYRNLVSRMFPILNQSVENYQSQKTSEDSKCKSINVNIIILINNIITYNIYDILNIIIRETINKLCFKD